MLWAVLAIMTSSVVLALARSLSERCEGFGARDSDVTFYRGLLAEADDDVRCGLVAPEDAVATRAEIGRRLLASLNSASEGRPRASRRRRPRRAAAALAIVVALPLVALASYLKVGAPSQPDMPIASRRTGGDLTLAAAVPDIHAGQARADIAALPPEQRSNAIRGMVVGLAEKLSKDGHDLQGWLQLIRSYVVLGERQKAEAAVASARAQLAGDAQAPARIDELIRQLGLKE
ncbi:cytochrome c-type biogenesis protein CcmI [Bradyrhizobium erythrophlei]|nr:cytochrome c-type biogenesis protein CcmI [Bradyrhizobium erythrophlei]